MSEYIVELDLDSVDAGIKYGPIVRCRDCAKYVVDWPGKQPEWCLEFKRFTDPDCFCAWAEQRDA